MKLNRRGYLAIEVILASVVAVTIAVFLMEITVKLVGITDDTYVETELLTDKALIVKNINELIDKDINFDGNRGIDEIRCSNNRCNLTYCGTNRRRYIEINDGKLIYGDSVLNKVLYSKNLSDKIDNIMLTSSVEGYVLEDDGYLLFRITADNKYLKDDFDVKIMIHNQKDC